MSTLILVLIVISVGVAIAWRSAPSQRGSGPALGRWCLVSGLVAAVSVALIGQASFGWVPGFDPPGWLRIVTFWMLPVSVIATAIVGTLSLRRDAGRSLGMTGIALAVLSTCAFFAMVVAVY